jgi:hypothetical protein
VIDVDRAVSIQVREWAAGRWRTRVAGVMAK